MGAPVYRFHNRKGRALLPTVLPCVGPVVSVNVLTGCSKGCVFCPARRYHPGTPVVYTDLPRQVSEELGRLEGRDELPRLVLFGTASDPFGEDSFVRELQFQSMLWILRHGLPLAFRTRGPVGTDFLDLFRRYREQVHATLVMGAMPPAVQDKLEPGTPGPTSRLADLEGLLGAEVDVRVRLEPLIPFVSDEESRLDPLFASLFRLGVRQVTGVSPTLHPAILADLGPSQACIPHQTPSRGQRDRDGLRPRTASTPQSYCWYGEDGRSERDRKTPVDRRPQQEDGEECRLGPVLRGLILGAFGLRQLDDISLHGTQRSGVPIPTEARRHMYERVARLAARHRIAFAPCACNNPDLGGVNCFAGTASTDWSRHRQREMLL